MVLGADYPFLDLLWTMLIFFLWIAWFMLLFHVIGDPLVADLDEALAEGSVVPDQLFMNREGVHEPPLVVLPPTMAPAPLPLSLRVSSLSQSRTLSPLH